jgi:4-hydroxy-4-methyl-2-oxoglutarate aldolase
MIHVHTKIKRPSSEQVANLARHSTATIHECQGRRGALHSSIKPVDYTMSLCGPAFTVACNSRDNIMLQVAISYAQPGDVLVVTGGGMTEAGMFGDVLCNAAIARRLGGLVIDAGVRDTIRLRTLGFPVFSRSICIRGTVKETLGPINLPIVIGGELVNPGDIVRGDADGVVVVRREEADEVAERSRAREVEEEKLIARYHAGENTISVCGLAPVLKAKGLIVEE